MSSLNINGSCGPNTIPTKTLRLIQYQYLNIVRLYVNYVSLQEFFGFFENSQSKSNLEVSNYRPNAILSNINSIFEKLVNGRFLDFLRRKMACITNNWFAKRFL